MATINRKTIKNIVEISGIGLHKGEQINLKLYPNYDNNGIIFKRVDLKDGENIIFVKTTNLFDLERGTNIKNQFGASVYTIEHFMSALHILGITDLVVEISGNELPILDGSSIGFLELVKRGEVIELDEKIEEIVIKEPIYYTDDKAGKHLVLLQYDGFKISYTIDFNHTFLKSQYYEINLNEEIYANEIAKARTFAFDYEIEFLKKNNLALGGSLDNAIVIGESFVHNKDGLRYETEFVRHKILDLIGDIYVLGRPIKGHIIAIKAGHAVNAEISKILEKNIDK